MTDPEKKEVSDLEVNNSIRRILTKKRIDANKLNIRSTRGSITVTGSLEFVGIVKDPEELPHDIAALEDQLKQVEGVSRVSIELDGFEKNDNTGDWTLKKGGKFKTKDEILREKKKTDQENQQKTMANIMLEDNADFSMASDSKDAVLSEIMSKIKKMSVKCPECKIEYKYCLTCGTKLKINIEPKVDHYEGDSAASSPAGASAPSAPSQQMSNADILADEDNAPCTPMPDDPNKYNPFEDDESPVPQSQAKDDKTLKEKALELLRQTKEAGIKKKSWSKGTPGGINFDFDDI